MPLNRSYLPNLEKNIWAPLVDPFYDRDSHYTIPYVVWMDGIGWRNDKVKEDIAGMDVPWDIFWHAQAYRGKVGILDDRRDALSMPMQRDAIRKGVRPELNTEDEDIVNKAQSDLSELSGICNPKVTITDYQTLPEGKTVLHQSWSGDLLSAAFYYLPKGTPADVLSFWGPEENGVVQNDFFCIGKDDEAARAGARVHQLHARREERLRQHGQLRRLHTASEQHRRGGADQAGPDPQDPHARRWCGPTSSPRTRSCSS